METETTVVETTRTKVLLWALWLFILWMVLMWILHSLITDSGIQDNLNIITTARKNIKLDNLKIADLQKDIQTQSGKIAKASAILKKDYNIIYR